MKHSYIHSAMAIVATAAMLSSCVSSEKIVYFQGSEEMFREPQAITQTYEMHIKPADQIYIKVGCSEPELLEPFNQDVVMGSLGGNRTSVSSMSMGSGSTLGNIYGYTVDNQGNVHLPVLGVVHVADLTCDEAAAIIARQIENKMTIKSPDVTVKLLNARVSVLGAAKSPRVVNLTSERNTILDVLAQCSDVDPSALRKKVLLFREADGLRARYELDLTQADIFNNPAFYVQQNDLIYIQHNKSENVKSSAFSTFLSAGAGILGFLSSVIALTISLTK